MAKNLRAARMSAGAILGFWSILAVSDISRAESVRRPHLEIELVSESENVSSQNPFSIAIRFKLEKHWHVYWKNPGDSGTPVKVEWNLPPGYHAGAIHWPIPHRIQIPPLVNFGYEDQVLLISEIQPAALASTIKEITISAHLQWLICKENCVPGKADVELKLPLQGGAKLYFHEKIKKEFDETRSLWPLESKIEMKALLGTDRIELRLPRLTETDSLFYAGDLEIFPATPGVVQNPFRPLLAREKNQLRIQIGTDENFKPTQSTPTLWTLSSETLGKGLDFKAVIPTARTVLSPIIPPADGSPAGPPDASLIFILALAFLGGIILNAMPCVFPVLSLKVLALLRNQAQSSHARFLDAAFFTLGITSAFLTLALSLSIFRAGGEQLGWGFQLQSPKFVAVLFLLFFGIGLNLLGVFEVGTRLMGIGSGTQSKHPLGASFLSGILTTIVATPCTAPFMGAAVGYALQQNLLRSLLVFLFIALGLAAPYAIFAVFPQTTRILPKPGRWMETLKQFFAFPIFATVIWLAWVFSLQAGADATGKLWLALLVTSLTVWASRRNPETRRSRMIFILGWILSLAIALQAARPMDTSIEGSSLKSAQNWEAFSEERIEMARAQGHPVFVDFTAAWCITCQVNKRIAIHASSVTQAFEKSKMVLMEADWTNQDPKISKMLTRYHRNGVPMYLLYPADRAKEPLLLPEVLTPGLIIERISEISP